jgi:DNA-binding CsgD family transcriptional regulator
VVAAFCCAGLAAILALEILTPDVVVESFELVPVLLASWLMSTRAAALVGVAAGLVLAIDFTTESANRPTVVLIGLVTLVTALAVRISAIRLNALIRFETRTHSDHNTIRLSGAAATGETFADLAVSLTARELRVARLAAQAYTASEIAQELHIGDRTVESHLARTYSKLGIRSKGELIRMAFKLEGEAPSTR